jgi:hypothetical protein
MTAVAGKTIDFGPPRVTKARISLGRPDDSVRTLRVPARELWLWQTPAALDSALRGLEQARRGEFAQWGSFQDYADMDVDE